MLKKDVTEFVLTVIVMMKNVDRVKADFTKTMSSDLDKMGQQSGADLMNKYFETESDRRKKAGFKTVVPSNQG